MANYVLVFEELVTVTSQELHFVDWPDFEHQLDECGLAANEQHPHNFRREIIP